jgi:hypothetical protein
MIISAGPAMFLLACSSERHRFEYATKCFDHGTVGDRVALWRTQD